ncbi:PREDICTED: serine/threonine-protein phosphatase 7 long form homolog [Erythranthe guttata]|uniref:serine/threonine-protein phosphatase 7 long form homolog n=1 Tax=Erythranthe guttata TaxID=4155 RepID=UPI00064DC5F5|nr:PREDICTED: serine/threonine-protein phosphatase 7 long form homolog [Erythranthe guttata]|eukprot:XP_012847959.1 PREDICTED: serine/threonine-protein phosphatase 7 long form homolog [Erythranthe guttata]
MVKLRSHGKSTWSGPIDARSISLLESTGLYHLRDCSLPQHNNPLIEAFIGRWQLDTNTFHMPFGEMTITLHDMHYIMHFPVSGHRPNTNMDKAQAIEEGVMVFGIDDALMEQWWYGGGPRLDQLDVMYGNNPTFPPEFRVRAYISYLLGKLLFVDKSGSKVKPDFFPLLEYIDQIHEYSWGSATLAFLYRQLGMASRAGAAQICGCLTLLDCWIHEYFLCFRPPMVNAHVPGEPWCKRWQVTHHIPKDEDIVVEYRRRLDSMRASDVNWTPFGLNVARDVDKTVHHRTIRWMDTVEPYMPDRALRQFGFVKRERKLASYKFDYEPGNQLWSIPSCICLIEIIMVVWRLQLGSQTSVICHGISTVPTLV